VGFNQVEIDNYCKDCILLDIVNLFAGIKYIDEIEQGEMLKGEERWGCLCGYATSFTPVTSFHC
jgi:hypothetical protein